MTSSPERKSITIIIADDQIRARRGLLAMLSTCPDVEVVAEASNGLEALRLVETHRPSLVIMDLHMPIMDGIEATRRIKASRPEIGVFVLTMYSERLTDAEVAGADALLVKGQPASTLVESIREYMERKRRRPAG